MRKQWTLLVIAVSCFILGAIIFYYHNIIIPEKVRQTEIKVRREIDEKAMPRKKVAVVTGKEGIAKYTVLTDEVINDNITMMEIPEKYVAQYSVSDIQQMMGKISKEDLRCGEQIVMDSLSTEAKWFEDYDRLKEYKVSGIVAGMLRSGNIIDLIVNYDNGTYDVVIPKIKVQKLIEQEQEKQKEYTLILAVNEEQYRDLELAKKLGNFETRIYLDESQPASVKTFDFLKAKQELNLDIYKKGG